MVGIQEGNNFRPDRSGHVWSSLARMNTSPRKISPLEKKENKKRKKPSRNFWQYSAAFTRLLLHICSINESFYLRGINTIISYYSYSSRLAIRGFSLCLASDRARSLYRFVFGRDLRHLCCTPLSLHNIKQLEWRRLHQFSWFESRQSPLIVSGNFFC